MSHEMQVIAEDAALVPSAGPAPAPNIGTPEPLVGNATFKLLLDLMRQRDDGIEVPLDATTLGEMTRDKVDAIQHVRIRLEADAASFRAEAEVWQATVDMIEAAAARCEKNLEDLDAYVAYEMKAHGETKIPGHLFRVALKTNPPAVETTRTPTALDFMEAEELVRQTTRYEWDKRALKDRLVEIEAMPDGEEKTLAAEALAFASLSRGQRVEFDANKPEKPVKKKKELK